MPPYSQEFRAEVLAACDEGEERHAIALRFRVSKSWVRRIRQRRETGQLAAKTTRDREPTWRAWADWLVAKIAARPDIYLCELTAAAYAETDQAEGLIAPWLDTGIVNLFLARLSATLTPHVQPVLVWDGAGYHRANDLRCPSNITLLSLPPYSPALDPVENLWHDLRSHHWSSRMDDTVDDLSVIQTICHVPDAETRC